VGTRTAATFQIFLAGRKPGTMDEQMAVILREALGYPEAGGEIFGLGYREKYPRPVPRKNTQ
jgi:hypothetical protein